MMLWCITVMLVAVLTLQTCAQPPYQVTRDVHPGCNTDIRLQPNNPIQVTRGDQGAPCVGYVQYDVAGPGADYRRMCATGNTLFTKANAQRVCYTLGLNMWRETNFNNNNDDQIMLYDCDVYTERNVDYPTVGSPNPVAGLVGTPYNYYSGKRCHPTLSQPDSFCYDECHIGAPQNIADETEDDCTILGGPFFAITCSDKDECNNGVLYDCLGPFPENCKRRDACGPNTECQNEIGSWRCTCETGYEPATAGDPYRVSVGCTDINECLDPDICGPLGQCRNTPGSYICVCIYPELWDPTTNMCTAITCNAVPSIPNANPTPPIPASPVYRDTVTFTCHRGYKVVHKMIPSYGLTTPYLHTPNYYDPYYWYSVNNHRTDRTFELTCTVSGHWGPYPLPSCVRPHCGHPGYVDNAVRTGDDYYYDKEVRYTCKKGYWPHGVSYVTNNYFTKTCQWDGTWTEGTYCEDIDECKNTDHYTCGTKAKYCHNTPGSYRCSCVPYSADRNDYDHYDCPDTPYYAKPCEELKRLGLCVNGECTEDEGKAYCSCHDGYHGTMCEKPWSNTALIIAIVALVLVFITIIIFIVFCCCYHGMGGHYGSHVGGPPVVAPIEPIYGRRKPILRPNFWHRY